MMDSGLAFFQMEIPAIFKILCLFGLIIALYRLKLPLWGALYSVSILSGLWFGAGIKRTLLLAGKSAVAPETLFLCSIVVLIMGFSTMMQKTGVMKRLVDSFTAMLGKSMYSGAALPALIGLLPMPGGAIFSAPMVETACGPRGCQTPEQKSAVNYWFRHIWEYWWPLYPGVILATNLFKAPMWKVSLLHFPLTAAAVFAGYFFILRNAFPETEPNGNGADRRRKIIAAVSESGCIIIVLLSIFTLGPILSRIGAANGLGAKYWPVIIGFILGIIWISAKAKTGLADTIRISFNRDQWSMVLLAAGTMMFRDMLTGINAFAGARADLEAYHVPPLAVIAALPFLAGFVMGLAVAFVGASFPLVISLLPDGAMDSQLRFAYLSLAYSCGYMGMMLSPVHFCLILTKDFFKADFAGIYRWLIGPAASVSAAGTALFLLYHRLFSP